MSKDSFDIDRIAKLARLELSEDERARMRVQFDGILSLIDKLDELSTDHIEAASHVMDLKNVFREDVRQELFDMTDTLSISPRHDKGHYEVPKII